MLDACDVNVEMALGDGSMHEMVFASHSTYDAALQGKNDNNSLNELEDGLFFPATGADGNMMTIKRSIETLTKTDLVNMCHEYHIPHSNLNKPELVRRLTEFSKGGMNHWVQELSTGARRNHRRPRNGPKKAPVKQSHKRLAAMFPTSEAVVAPAGNTMPAVAFTVDNCTEEEKELLLKWADNFVGTYMLELPASAVPSGSIATLGVASALVPAPLQAYEERIVELSTSVSQLSEAVAILKSGQSGIPMSTPCDAQVQDIPTASRSATPATTAITSPAHGPPEPVVPAPALIPSISRSPSPSISELPSSSSTASELETSRRIELGDIVLTITRSQVPEPPATSFVKDIQRLNEMWDDTSPFWKGKSDLVIAGHPIALVYWPHIFKYWHHGYWAATKTKWAEWREVVYYYRAGTPEQFRTAFMNSEGKLLPWKTIHQRLVQMRQERDRKQAVLARIEFAASWSSKFSYRKGKSTFTMTKDSCIARQYRRLKEILSYSSRF
ncbi:hypothetical protein H0H92_001352 [Tricholoma furcatifolium]|nr:hypothetical protein H0H92_001352 [Tricholoma furcatifolium]